MPSTRRTRSQKDPAATTSPELQMVEAPESVATNPKKRRRAGEGAQDSGQPLARDGKDVDETLGSAPPAKRRSLPPRNTRRESETAANGLDSNPNGAGLSTKSAARTRGRLRQPQQPTPRASHTSSVADGEEADSTSANGSGSRAAQNRPPPTPETLESAEDGTEPDVQPTIENAGSENEAGNSAAAARSSRRPRSDKTKGKAKGKAPEIAQVKVSNEDDSDEAAEDDEEEGDSDAAGPSKAKNKQKKKRARAVTPPEYAKHQVETASVRMDFLTKETKYGSKSKRETAMQKIDWDEVKKRKKAEALEAAQSRENPQETHHQLQPAGPQLRLDAHGNILVDHASLSHDRAAAAMADVEEMEVLEEDDLTNRITTQSLTMAEARDPHGRSGRGRGERWSTEETEQFFRYLGMFGTDFMIISTMFPKKTRRQIKMKFTREERGNAARVRDALIHGASDGPGRMDFEAYKQAAGKTDAEFRDPRALEQELQEELERERLNIERAKREHQEKQRQAQAQATEGHAGDKTQGDKGKRKEKGKKNTPAPTAIEENVEVLEEFDD